MFRVIIGIIVSLFMVSLLRMIVGAISREVGGAGSASKRPQNGTSSPGGSSTASRPPAPAGGELRKCPSCGAYHATTAIAAKSQSGELLHFCSLACREKFTA